MVEYKYMKNIFTYLNPIKRLGIKKYSILLPTLVTFFFYFISEFYAYNIAKNPLIVGVYIIFVSASLIIYFSFHDGILGGIIASTITILYYAEIMYTRHYRGAQLSAGISTTIVLAIVFYCLAAVIGWLKQTIDGLIVNEGDEKRRLQAIVDQLPVGVLITDAQGKITQGNKKIEEILQTKISQGTSVKDNLIMQSRHDGKIVNPSEAPLVQVLRTRKPIVGKEYVIDRVNGKQTHLQVNASAISNKDGKLIAAASIISDITQQKEMETRKDDFVNMASHELKTPLTSMKIYIDLLTKRIKQSQDNKSIKILKNIENQTEKLQELVNDLLDVSRLQTGKLMFTKEQFRLDALIRETIEGLQEVAKNHKIVFSSNKATSIYADRFRIYQVLTNLLTNAIKYSKNADEIIVSLQRSRGKAIVRVQDFGIGIAKDQQKKIFDRLYQVTDHQEKTFPGLGMGLYISKEIVKRHKGCLWVESEKNKGSTFIFSLPLK